MRINNHNFDFTILKISSIVREFRMSSPVKFTWYCSSTLAIIESAIRELHSLISLNLVEGLDAVLSIFSNISDIYSITWIIFIFRHFEQKSVNLKYKIPVYANIQKQLSVLSFVCFKKILTDAFLCSASVYIIPILITDKLWLIVRTNEIEQAFTDWGKLFNSFLQT